MKFECPIYIDMPRKTKKPKRYWLNKNNERNWHFIVNNNLKTAFCSLMDTKYQNTDKNRVYPLKITYRLIYGSKRRVDYSNICCLIQKFFEDWLVTRGIIPDDSTEYITGTEYIWSGYQKDTYKVLVELTQGNIVL